ncbi:hypothetical protein [Peribacillus acanthi]|uniref:hypothetical protein n=1 Tax=Peribacillus acanthi TaxID=2171554 RepID=UPI000D3EE0CB|nr:hypothetical protein [Peribacillus acanthi]
MSNVFEQEKDAGITELMKVFPFEDVELDDDIREWLQQIPSIQIKDYGFDEPDSEEEYFAILNEITEYLMER